MDENRTHPGRLNSAPQTVLKTAGHVPRGVQRRPSKLESLCHESADIHDRPPTSVLLAVFLAVTITVDDPARAASLPSANH